MNDTFPILTIAADSITEDEQLGGYARRGRGGIYLRSGDPKGANPLRLAEFGARTSPRYFWPTLARIRQIPLDRLIAVLDRLPPGRFSEQAHDFAKSLMAYTYSVLVDLRP